ncbi:mannitol dehydrogenase family protein [Pseudooctadecabacter jejudonensis]|uniref:Mannitol 2-dehydrogenase n=1 Tax=Pseudooctadecabacter jejudonensis TaxID=1391910 RepID=A0A1Y5TLM1_9RHOB|nr:mannitol dehydrogenase family protein [Pseudooctadecabacter jejudonensis]SLN63269.1 Mannitol 2-dehydrogenase [Pseudooctadecabacter jejudonensis]
MSPAQDGLKPRLMRQGSAPDIGIVHLGPGAFFRAFNAEYTHDAMAHSGGDWGILAVCLRSATARDQLVPQGGLFTSVTLDEGGMLPKTIGSVRDVLVAPENPAGVVDAMADAAVKIVSLTITEKGYCRAPATGTLDLDHPDIAHDLSQLSKPRSAVGFIVAALAARRATGVAPFVVLSCDNLPSNGPLTRNIVSAFARQVDTELADWIATNVSFPATMVDRITPATTDADRAALADLLDARDEACVFHEAFRQWVIEDDFPTGRPAWDMAGAQLVTSVADHEEMKLRCLNGTHSMLAYLGYLAGYETIADTVADPNFAQLCRMAWDEEIIPTLTQPDGEDLPAYRDALLRRYLDRALKHRTWQIAMDGSQKLPQRILATVADSLGQGRQPRALALAVAGWMRYVGGVDETGAPIDVRDPMADLLRRTCDGASDDQGRVRALLALDEIFPPDLAANPNFEQLVQDAYASLVSRGAKGAVADLVSG